MAFKLHVQPSSKQNLLCQCLLFLGHTVHVGVDCMVGKKVEILGAPSQEIFRKLEPNFVSVGPTVYTQYNSEDNSHLDVTRFIARIDSVILVKY